MPDIFVGFPAFSYKIFPCAWTLARSHFCKTTSLGAVVMNRMTLNPCITLSFDGQCQAAFQVYERCLNGKITFLLTWGDSPMAKDAPPDWSSKILHATLAVGNTRLQGSDPLPGSYESPRGFAIKLNPSEDDAERLFAELAEGGMVHVPLEKTFWAPLFGVVTDRFGIPWVINCEKSE